METEIREEGNGNGGDALRRGQWQKRYGTMEILVCGVRRGHPIPSQEKSHNCKWDDMVTGTVDGRDSMTTERVTGGGDTEEMQEN